MDTETLTTAPTDPGAASAVLSDGAARAALIQSLDLLTGSPSERLERIVRTARDVLGARLSYINLIDEDTLHTLTPRTGDPESVAAERTFCQYTVDQAEPLLIPDAAADPRYASLPVVTEYGLRFYAGVPITMPGGVRIGSFCIMDSEPRVLTDDERTMLGELSRWAERAISEGLERDRVDAVLAAVAPEPVELDGWVVDGFTRPVGQLGGDAFDWTVVDGTLVVSAVDVTGAGEGASVLAAGIRGALGARAAQGAVEAVTALEAQVAPAMRRARAFATLFHARVDLGTGAVETVDAGHGTVLHLRADGSSDILRSSDLPLALHPTGVPRSSAAVHLEPGDALVIATDGVLDLGTGTLDTLTVLGRKLDGTRDDDGLLDVGAFLDEVRARAVGHAEDDLTVVVVARR